MITLALAAALATTPSSPAQAPQHDGAHMVFGHGLRSCGEWTRDRRAQGEAFQAKVSWLAGYLTGENAILAVSTPVHNILEGMDLDAAIAWIDRRCAESPQESLATAAQALSTDLLNRRLRAR